MEIFASLIFGARGSCASARICFFQKPGFSLATQVLSFVLAHLPLQPFNAAMQSCSRHLTHGSCS